MELVERVATIALQPSIYDSYGVEEGDGSVNVGRAEDCENVFGLDGVLNLDAVDHDGLFHNICGVCG